MSSAAPANLDSATLAMLGRVAVSRDVPGGELLIHAGDPPGSLYIVAAGRFLVEARGRVVGEIGIGEPIGELSFFSGVRRTANVRAARDARVLEVTREAYDAAAARDPRLGEAITAALCRRLIATTAASAGVAARPPRVLAMLPAGDAPLPDGFAAKLGMALAKRGGRLVTCADAPAAGVGEWLATLEESVTSAVLLASPGDPPAWGETVCRNADALVLVAPLADAPGAFSPLEAFAARRFPESSTSLLLWRAPGTAIAGTPAWLATRPATLHHHLATDSAVDFARVARFLTGRAVGIVLAGGGALGCAHLGVMRALREARVPIDFLGGASAGAAMAAAVARGLTPQETLDQMEAMFVTARAMKRLTLPVHSLLDPRVFDAQLQARYGTLAIEDLPLNLFAVSTSLTRNALHIHRRGALWEAVRASGSLPTILPPMITDDGEVLVDGGVLDNIPVATMRGFKAGPNIVVPLGGSEDLWRVAGRYAMLRTPLQLVRDIVLRRGPSELPSIIDVLSRAMVVASRRTLAENLAQADILLSPPLTPGMRILDWQLGRALAEAAYLSTQVALSDDAKLSALVDS
ncbi:patatin-like phospholipase family protein [Glacieibacterium frigidum]|uniref:Cyclic nucleotide-binding domain-containing protein n=1 Tax=Glacieibacterium frigidum TaxID=2593303 RepID=A0A552UHP4_9SPHN|nr:cyclic nucleotide-binding and patatin-like phospholipase domain-containing protein [Glacieibacterium frigidum]TRW17710.1 cyclic nucleotide-binding domain-containing protein [Glacieibacterium frigidum]